MSTIKKIPCISLINNDGDRKDGIGKRWRENWSKCIDRPVNSEADVRVGDTGSIGIGYWVLKPLDILLRGKTEKEKKKILIAENPTVGKDSLGHEECYEASHFGEIVSPQSLNSVTKFFNFTESPNGSCFVIKRGTKGLWLAKKSSGYYHAPPSFRASGPLISYHQNSPNYFEHRFRFEIIRLLTDEEALLPHHCQLIFYKSIQIPT